MGWIDNIVITIVVVMGLGILYKALKEPLDLVFGGIKSGIISLKNMITNRASDAVVGGYETITYG